MNTLEDQGKSTFLLMKKTVRNVKLTTVFKKKRDQNKKIYQFLDNAFNKRGKTQIIRRLLRIVQILCKFSNSFSICLRFKHITFFLENCLQFFIISNYTVMNHGKFIRWIRAVRMRDFRIRF